MDGGPSESLSRSPTFLLDPVGAPVGFAQARIALNRLLLPVLRNQLADLSSRPDLDDTPPWEDVLASEIAAMEADAQRLPWEDGVPEIVERSLRPYRDRLDGSYGAMCNAIEIGLARHSPNLATHEAHSATPDA